MAMTDALERHLLIVDDDDRIRDLLKQYLRRAGFRVTAAPGGAQARRLSETLDFDLAVFDVMMPGEDGMSLTRWLREQKGPAGQTPVLMLTARGEAEARIEGLRIDEANVLLGLRLNEWTSILVGLGALVYLIVSARLRPASIRGSARAGSLPKTMLTRSKMTALICASPAACGRA